MDLTTLLHLQAKTVHIQLDGRQVSPLDGYLIRKGPGTCFFDFMQEVSFTEPCTPREPVRRGDMVKARYCTYR